MMAGRAAPTNGVAKNSCLAASAAWNYVAVIQWILGNEMLIVTFSHQKGFTVK
jgi:cellobiose phosphorylase